MPPAPAPTRTKIRVAYGTIVNPETGRRHTPDSEAELAVNLRDPFWRRRLADKSVEVVAAQVPVNPESEE